MNIVGCNYELHAPPILAILNDAIVSSTALFDYRPREPASMVEWFRAKEARGFPVLGAVDSGGELLGFATYGTFRLGPRTNTRSSTPFTCTKTTAAKASRASS